MRISPMSDQVIVYLAIMICYATAWWLVRVRTKPAPSRVGEARRLRAQRLMLRRALPKALESGQIYLVYQPKLQLRSGEINDVEALIRWDHPCEGSVDRSLLVMILEESGYMRAATVWVIRRAIEDQAILATAGQWIRVYVNVSASLLTDEEFVRQACALIRPACGAIGIEITETAIIGHSPTALSNLRRITEHGGSVSIDDYGSGLSSLAYLKELPAEELKIDKMFVSDMTTSHRDPLIVRSTIDLAHALGLTVVAEGVESLGVLALLKVMGCDAAQGYLISEPLPLFGLRSFLEEAHYRSLLKDAAASLSPPADFWARTRTIPEAVHHLDRVET